MLHKCGTKPLQTSFYKGSRVYADRMADKTVQRCRVKVCEAMASVSSAYLLLATIMKP